MKTVMHQLTAGRVLQGKLIAYRGDSLISNVVYTVSVQSGEETRLAARVDYRNEGAILSISASQSGNGVVTVTPVGVVDASLIVEVEVLSSVTSVDLTEVVETESLLDVGLALVEGDDPNAPLGA